MIPLKHDLPLPISDPSVFLCSINVFRFQYNELPPYAGA